MKNKDSKIFCVTVGKNKKPSAKTYYAEDTTKVRKLLKEFNGGRC